MRHPAPPLAAALLPQSTDRVSAGGPCTPLPCRLVPAEPESRAAGSASPTRPVSAAQRPVREIVPALLAPYPRRAPASLARASTPGTGLRVRRPKRYRGTGDNGATPTWSNFPVERRQMPGSRSLLTEIRRKVTSILSFATADGGEQVAQFVINLSGGRDCLTDFLAQQLLVAAAQAVHGDLDCLFRHVKPPGNLRIGLGGAVTGKGLLQGLKESPFTRALKFFAQADERLLEQGQCPASLKDRLRSRGVGGFEMIAALACLKVQRHDVPAAATLLRLVTLARLRQEMLEGGQQEGAKLAACGI